MSELAPPTDIVDMPPLFYSEMAIVGDLRERIGRLGSLSLSVHEIFEESDVHVTVHGDTSRWEHDGQGAIFYGDHSQRVEYIPITAMLGSNGRSHAHVLAKPYTRTATAVNSLGPQAEGVIIPVIPNNLASDRGFRNIWNKNLYYRVMHGRHLPTSEQIRTVNRASVQRCADVVAEGGVVNLYPTGSIRDATTSRWYEGIGRVVKLLPEEARKSTMLVPFQFDRFSIQRLLRSIGMYSQRKPQGRTDLHMRLGRQGTPQELLGDGIDTMTAAEITEALKSQFINAFSKV